MRFGGAAAGVLRPARPLPPHTGHSVPEWAIFLCVDLYMSLLSVDSRLYAEALLFSLEFIC